MSDDRLHHLRQALRLGPCPALGAPSYVKLLRADFRHPVRGYFTADRVLGVEVHWCNDRRTDVPCWRKGNGCYFCLAGRSTHWKGYVAGALWPDRSRRLVEITSGAYRNSSSLLALDGSLAGCWFELTRLRRGRNNAPARILVKDHPRVENLEPAFDELGALARIWQLPCDAETGQFHTRSFADVASNGAGH